MAEKKTTDKPTDNEKGNLYIYNKASEVPKNAQKTIPAGKLKGMTDINPMWRIKMLTELFGPCGIGWYTEIVEQWTESGSDNIVSAFCNINLYIKDGENWSMPIAGTGGSAFISKDKNGLNTSDEAFKMAYTDALSVACKALGIGANIYWEGGKDSKYSTVSVAEYKCVKCGKPFEEFTSKENKYFSAQQVYHMSETKNGIPLCKECANIVKTAMAKQIEKEQVK